MNNNSVGAGLSVSSTSQLSASSKIGASNQDVTGEVFSQHMGDKKSNEPTTKSVQVSVDLHDQSLHIMVGDDKQIHVKVVDNETGRIIREIPAKSAMQLLSDWTGIWVDLKA